MKKSLLVFGFVLLAVLMFNSCGSSSSKEKQSTTQEVTKVQYTCPMHSEVVSDKPGDCPKCGMALVEKK
jgi:ABC-type Zn uptake system ZnuABC Zn-binding protein ZnuA